MFARPPSDRAPSLRTHVPPLAQLNACAARARCRSPHTLVPTARGRLRRRLGGRPERACRGPSSAPSGAAQAREDRTSRPPAGAGSRVPVPGQPCSGPARGPSPGERAQRRAERASHAARRQLPAVAPTPAAEKRTGRPQAAHRFTKNRRRPTLPGPCEPSTIGAEGLNCSVRNGKRCFPLAKATGKTRETTPPRSFKTAQRHSGYH